MRRCIRAMPAHTLANTSRAAPAYHLRSRSGVSGRALDPKPQRHADGIVLAYSRPKQFGAHPWALTIN
jgi:hypothetical protein